MEVPKSCMMELALLPQPLTGPSLALLAKRRAESLIRNTSLTRVQYVNIRHSSTSLFRGATGDGAAVALVRAHPSRVANTPHVANTPTMNTDWFNDLFGFEERSPEQVRAHLEVDGTVLRSRTNEASYQIGVLETPSLGELRTRAGRLPVGRAPRGPIRVRNVVGEAGALHADPRNAGALFQVASQFNLLEMVSPDVSPEDGVTRYICDRTQGPACAIAAGAATVYRNYFVLVDGKEGQESDRQIDCLRDIHETLSPVDQPLWEMRNGYALPTARTLAHFNPCFAQLDEVGRDALRAALRIGIHRDVEVTRSPTRHLVSQVFCSALPLSYSSSSSPEWESFARLILEATYEGTLLAAAENAERNPSAPVYLTKVGGGVFRNPNGWIVAAMDRAFQRLAETGLDVRIVHYSRVHERFHDVERG